MTLAPSPDVPIPKLAMNISTPAWRRPRLDDRALCCAAEDTADGLLSRLGPSASTPTRGTGVPISVALPRNKLA